MKGNDLVRAVVARWLAASRATAVQLLDAYAADPSAYNKAELSDWGINTFREQASHFGYDRSDLMLIMREELGRARGIPPTSAGLLQYLKTRRSGSHFRMTRLMRTGLFCQLVAKGALR